MRFIHTSDWHIGQTLHQFERAAEHQAFLDWLVATLLSERVDALLIAGDIFDTANPSASAQKQFYRFLQQAKAALPQLDIVIIAGNHDSPGRLEAPLPLLEGLQIHVIGAVPRDAAGAIEVARLVVPLHGADGSIAAWCIAIPFLRPGDVPRLPAPTTEAEAAAPLDPYLAGIALLYQQATAHARGLCSAAQPLIAMGHCHMVGGEISAESERSIVIGGSEALSAALFDSDIAYAALGHLHLSQQVARQAHLRYCGSPLPLSFAEIDYPHQVLRVDLANDGSSVVTPLPVPRAVALLRVPRQPAPLAQVLLALTALDVPSDVALELQPYLEVRVKLTAPEPGLRSAIETALEGKAVRLAKIDISFVQQQANGAPAVLLEDLAQLQPEHIFERLYQQHYAAETPAALHAAFAELLLTTERGTR